MTYTVGTLFSGIGVPDLCARLLGMETVWQVEKEAFPQAVLRKNFPEAVLHGDIFDCHDLPYVDVIVAGFPCQPFSTAGEQRGDRDPRYLVPEMLRVIDEVRPRICLLENVPGFASLDDGKSFKSLLGALAEMGFDAEWGHIRASDVGAPHQRERWFCVGYTTSRVQQDQRTGDTPAWLKSQPEAADRIISGHIASGVSNDRCADTSGARGMGNAKRRRFTGRTWRRASAQLANRHAWNGRLSKPRLGRNLDGFTSEVDGFTPYPARPGKAQFAFEPARVAPKGADHAKRLKALGNSMAVDVVFEIMRAIKLWLEAQDGAA